MSADIYKQSVLFVVFALAQTLILGHIHLFGYATPSSMSISSCFSPVTIQNGACCYGALVWDLWLIFSLIHRDWLQLR